MRLFVSGAVQAVVLPVLAGAALQAAFPAAAARMRLLSTLATAALLAVTCGGYVAHGGGAVVHAWPALAFAVLALHAGEGCWFAMLSQA